MTVHIKMLENAQWWLAWIDCSILLNACKAVEADGATDAPTTAVNSIRHNLSNFWTHWLKWIDQMDQLAFLYHKFAAHHPYIHIIINRVIVLTFIWCHLIFDWFPFSSVSNRGMEFISKSEIQLINLQMFKWIPWITHASKTFQINTNKAVNTISTECCIQIGYAWKKGKLHALKYLRKLFEVFLLLSLPPYTAEKGRSFIHANAWNVRNPNLPKKTISQFDKPWAVCKQLPNQLKSRIHSVHFMRIADGIADVVVVITNTSNERKKNVSIRSTGVRSFVY